MKFSLITPTYNSAKTILDTLRSVSDQTWPDLEYIIIDGASQDNTVEIIKDYSQKNNLSIHVVSEPDQGLYDAMNKGLKLASGNIIGILNSDDLFKNGQTLAKVAACFRDNIEADACYGDLEFIRSDNLDKIVRFWRAGEYQEKKLRNGWIIPHPTFFAKREIYNKFGAFRPEFRLAGDYELLLRLLKIKRIKVSYIPTVLTKMRVGGESSRNLRQRYKGWQELRLAWSINGLKCPSFFIIRRVLSKIKQYIGN